MTHKEFLNAFMPINEVFKSELSTGLLNVYFTLLKKYDYASLQKAVIEILQTHKYNTLPKVAEFIEILENGSGKEARLEAKALNAWERAEFARNYHGIYKSVCFEDLKITQTIVNVFGDWVKFCNSSQGHNWDRKSFIDAYKTIADKEFSPVQRIYYLQGLTEKESGINEKYNYIAIVGKNANSKGIYKLSYPQMQEKIRQIQTANNPILSDEKHRAFNEAIKSITGTRAV